MKRLLVLALSFLMVFTYNSCSTSASDELEVILDGNLISFDVPAQIIDGRTMVPVRKIFETLGMTVDWNEQTQTVSAYKPGVFLELPIGNPVIYRNTVEQEVDVPAQILGGRTLVPVRVVSEYAGADVFWSSETNAVYITSNNKIQHLDWNDNYEYFGEVENGRAVGYGILYNKNNSSIAQLGKYIDSQIVVGTDYFDNGDIYVGNYEDATFSYGTYYYANGNSYTGEFQNSKKHGQGTYNYANGSFHKGKWENDLPNGLGIFYDAVEDFQAQGVFVNGKRSGRFTIDDFYMNESYTITYDDTNEKSEYQNKVDEYYKKVDELDREYANLYSWYEGEVSELYDYIQNGDPFSTDWAKSIYKSYGITVGTSPADSNLDSFAARNSQKQQAALKSKADSEILEYNSTYIANQKQLIEDAYNLKKGQLDEQKQSLETEKAMLGL